VKHHELLLENLSLSQVEEALSCLHLELEPQSPELQKLEPRDWLVLVGVLHQLMQEKQESSLH
jgi:hypothetical protein